MSGSRDPDAPAAVTLEKAVRTLRAIADDPSVEPEWRAEAAARALDITSGSRERRRRRAIRETVRHLLAVAEEVRAAITARRHDS